MPKFVPEFTKRCPNVELDIRDLFTADITEALNLNMIDIAILSGGYQVKIKETKLFKDKLYLYVSPRNKLYNRNEVNLDEVDVKQLLILSEGNCLRNQALKLMCLKKLDVESPFNFANTSLETLMNTVDATSAVTVIPGMAIDFIPEEKRKQIKPFSKVDAHRKVSIAVSRTYVKEALVNAVKESATAVSKMGMAEFLV
jgi:LysR family hydrogen peroxide-inducible transcriptional activator